MMHIRNVSVSHKIPYPIEGLTTDARITCDVYFREGKVERGLLLRLYNSTHEKG